MAYYFTLKFFPPRQTEINFKLKETCVAAMWDRATNSLLKLSDKLLLLNLPVNQYNFFVDLISCISEARAVWVDTFVVLAACVKYKDRRSQCRLLVSVTSARYN